MPAHRTQRSIAVIGVSALFPGSHDARGFWRDILAGRDLITEVPESRWLIGDHYDPDPLAPDKTYCKRGAFLKPTDFDPMEFGIPPAILPATDTAQLLALVVAQKVLEDAAQGQFAGLDRERMSVILGVTSAQELMESLCARLQRPVWVKALRESGLPEPEVQAACDRIAQHYVSWQESSFPGLLGNVVAGRIANRFDLRGTNCVTDAACASSLSALSMGIHELQLGEADVVIAGGVDAANDIFMYMCFSKTPALSITGDCRPFSESADGTMLGEGLGMLALKRLEDAERDADRIYAVIQGVGSSSDGRSKSVYAPLPEGQARALRRAYANAGYSPATVELVEAHGTGTFAGDAAEFEGLKQVFGPGSSGRDDVQWCALGSVKSQIGHTKAAAGAAGLFKAVMALHHKVLPPTIKVDRPNPKLELEKSPFYLNTVARPWIRDASYPRRASVSSFGFGGSNFHVTLEEYAPGVGRGQPAFRFDTNPTQLVLLSAGSGAELAIKCRALAGEGEEIDRTARSSQASFRATDRARLAVVAADRAELVAKLEQAVAALTNAPEQPFSWPTGTHYAIDRLEGGVAFLFPGQGSQYLQMGADLAMAVDEARRVWDEAAELRFDGVGVHEVVFPRPAFTDADREAQSRRLTATEWAQPALGLSSLALLEVLRTVGVSADCVGGHSFGEITALHAAGVIDARSLVRIARMRGELMRDAGTTPGAMTAVSRGIEEVRTRLEAWGLEVVVANHNSPTQVVLSGPAGAIDEVERRLAAEGIAAKRLPVACAFHSPLVAGSVEPFHAFLAGIDVATPAIDVYSNAEAAVYPADPAAIRRMLADQIGRPVRLVEEIEAMYARGIRTFIEVGPGAVLTDQVTRILGGRAHLAVSLDRRGRHGVTSLQDGLGRLAVGGLALDFDRLWARFRPVDPVRKKKPLMTVPIAGTNVGKPYPPPGGAKALPPPNPPRAAEVASPVVTRVLEPSPAAEREAPAVSSPVSGAVASRPAVTPPVPVNAPASAPANGVSAKAASSPQPVRVCDADLGWMHLYQEGQRQLTETHAAYQRAMAESHVAFMRAMESSFLELGGMLASTAGPDSSVPFHPHPAAARPTSPVPLHPHPAATRPTSPVNGVGVSPWFSSPPPLAGEGGPKGRERAEQPGRPSPATTSNGGAAGATSPGTGALPSGSGAAPAVDLTALMLSVVAEKTGYPVEMLEMPMELEADLGIDSIKRVEILSSIRERVPGLPDVKASELAALRTLGQIVEYMDARRASVVASQAPAPVPPEGPAVDLTALMLSVVAEKTGYPVEMLEMHMELEADLGIDSIKRVEILSSIRERVPGLPDVKASELAALRTLGQIVEYMDAQRAGTAGKNGAVVTPAAGAGTIGGAERADDAGIRRFVVREVASEAVGLELEGLSKGGRVVVTDDGAGVAGALARKLRERGLDATVELEAHEGAGVVIFLGGLRPVATLEEAMAVNREAFQAAKAVSARFGSDGGVFVTVQDTGGDFGLSGREPVRAWLGGISALARTAALEWPDVSVKAIDLERGDQSPELLADRLVEELFSGGSTLEVGLHADGRRTTLRTVPASLEPAGASPLEPGAVLLVSGGARGVTATALEALARAHRPRIVLLGRTALEEEPAAVRGAADDAAIKRALMQAAKEEGRTVTPATLGDQSARILAGREVRATLEALRRAGSEVRYVAADVQDAAAIQAALAGVRLSWGPITGIVHGAGLLADKRIVDKSLEQYDRVFGTKVHGLKTLLEATAIDPLRVICLFSSIVARTGNVGQSDYAMANEVLNLVACAERARRGINVHAIGWGPWAGGMVTPALRDHFEKRGVPLISLETGARLLVEEIDGASPDAEVLIGGALERMAE